MLREATTPDRMLAITPTSVAASKRRASILHKIAGQPNFVGSIKRTSTDSLMWSIAAWLKALDNAVQVQC
jgi:hypothetical protein